MVDNPPPPPGIENFPRNNMSQNFPQDNSICPSCKRPYSTGEKKFLGIPVWGWIIVIILILVIGSSIVPLFFLFFMDFGMEPEDDIETYSSRVFIEEGGHFRYMISEGWYDEIEIEFEITSSNGNYFDVYVMDFDQYYNSYGNMSQTTRSFSSYYSSENVNHVEDTLDLGETYREYYIIIDNKRTSITPDDADPDGTIAVDLDLTIMTTYVW